MKPFNETGTQELTFTVGKYGLHGDVILSCEATLPDNFDTFERIKDDCLAYGEVTGHAHKMFGDEFEVRENPATKERWLKVVTPSLLKHQEHSPIKLPPGFYKIGIQREYDPFTKHIRTVQD